MCSWIVWGRFLVSRSIPLVRTGSIRPVAAWIEANGGSAERYLSGVGLGRVDLEQRERPVAMLAALAFLCRVARDEGAADLGLRVIRGDSFWELGRFGQLATVAKTPRDLLTLVTLASPRFCTHQRITIDSHPDAPTIRFRLPDAFGREEVHLTQQYNIGMVEAICAATGLPGPYFSRIAMPPDARGGVDALKNWFDCPLTIAPSSTMALSFEPDIADRPFVRHPSVAQDRGVWLPLREELDFRSSALLLIGDMLADETPTVGRLAELSGMSLRTMQRRLEADGTSFSALLDEVRRNTAIAVLANGDGTLSDLAAGLGYAGQSCLTRAVRRWMGAPPRELRERLAS